MTDLAPPLLAVVVPCYNEEEVLPSTAQVLADKLAFLVDGGQVDGRSRVVFVDDGSTDATWEVIEKLHAANPHLGGIKLSRNRGHQNALLAGLMTLRDRVDVTITLDADLQDDVHAIDRMLAAHREGAEIVYGVRDDRSSDTAFKRRTAHGFYALMTQLGAHTVEHHADYRLMSSRALRELAGFEEVNLFLRGLVPLLGFRTATVHYERSSRLAGQSKYPLRKMLGFAIDGITSFSTRPLRAVGVLGAAVSTIALLVMVYAILAKVTGHAVAGWTFTVVSVWFIGGVQMLALGVVGEYVGKIYSETKRRPRFIVEHEI
ncbi:glycosyltransferase [Nocardioides sp. AN3]